MIIDTHCHYNLLENDWRTQWQTAQEHGVGGAIVVGVGETANHLATSIVATTPGLKAALGFHPENYEVTSPITNEALVQRCISADHDVQGMTALLTDQVIAIGETGLDYFRLPADPQAQHQTRQLQRHAFIQHILFAHTHQLPLIIHVRDSQIPEVPTPDNAYWDTLRLLREYHQGYQPFILHCVSGPLAYIHAAVELGAYIGIAGNITYKNADHMRSIVKTTPQDRVLVETDAPFLPPVPHRGQPCDPWMISLTAEFLATELDITMEILLTNTLKLFPAFRQSVT